MPQKKEMEREYMMYFGRVLRILCPTCNRLIKVHISLPVGKSAIYGCEECRTQLVHVAVPKEYLSETHYLVETFSQIDATYFSDDFSIP